MTLSISARCPESGQLGIAISSSSMAVGSRCPWLLPGVGAVASQNITLPSLGPQILSALEAGASVEQALNLALAEDRFREYRQVAAIDANGDTAVFSGEFTLGIGGALAGDNCVAAGNMLAGPGAPAAMGGAVAISNIFTIAVSRRRSSNWPTMLFATTGRSCRMRRISTCYGSVTLSCVPRRLSPAGKPWALPMG